MIPKTTRRSKRYEWSVYVVVETEGYEGRVLVRKPKSTKHLRYMHSEPVIVTKEYLYLDAVKMYKKNGILYIVTGSGKKREVHKHEMKRVKGIWKREYNREGVQ